MQRSRTVSSLSQHRHWWDWDLSQGALGAMWCSPSTTKLLAFLPCVAPRPRPVPQHGGESPTSLCPLLCDEHQEQQRGVDCPLHVQALIFPCALLRLPPSKLLSSYVSVPLLLPLDWRKDDSESITAESCGWSCEPPS